MNLQIVDGVHWVGHVDWNIRDFHGYVTDRGSSYNAYLILDKEPALVDSVKAPYDEVQDTVLFFEAKTYVANILMLYPAPVTKAVAAVRKLDTKIIAPSHGVVWRGRVKQMLDLYDNGTLMPAMADALTCLKGLRPANKAGFACLG